MNRKPKIGDRVTITGIPQFFQVEMTIKGILLESIFVRPKRGREDIEVSEDQITYLEPEELESGEKVELVKKWVKEESLTDILMIRREIGVLNKLFKKYPSAEFWRRLEIGFQMRSLLWWAGAKGSPQIEQKFKQFTLDKLSSKSDNKGSNFTLLTEKIGEDVKVENKPKNLLDILK